MVPIGERNFTVRSIPALSARTREVWSARVVKTIRRLAEIALAPTTISPFARPGPFPRFQVPPLTLTNIQCWE